MMTRYILFILSFLFWFSSSAQQIIITSPDSTINLEINLSLIDDSSTVEDADTILVKDFKLNFAIPDQPAFKILGVESSNILRPSSPEVISVITSNFFDGATPVLPNSFSMELAPLMLIGTNDLTLNDYDKNSILYSTRFSVGSQLDEENGQSRNLALGGRVTLIDKGDLKNDTDYRKELYKLTAELVELDNKLKAEWLDKNSLTIREVIVSDSLNQLMESYISSERSIYNEKPFSERIAVFKEKYRKLNWNKQKLDIAIATLWSSPDSLVGNLGYSRFSSWLTYAHPIKNWGQLLFGINYTNSQLDMLIDENLEIITFNEFSLSSRLYFGTNRIKGFLEAQYEYLSNMKVDEFLFNSGAEINIRDGIWVNFNIGVDLNRNETIDKYQSNLIGSFDIRFTLPEDFKYF